MKLSTANEVLTPVLTSGLFHDDIESSGAETLTLDYAILDLMEKLCVARKKALKPAITAAVKAAGVKTEKGHFTLSFQGAEATLQNKIAKLPDDGGLRALLTAKQVPIDDAFDVIKSLVINPSKLDSLISLGVIEQDAVDSLRQTSTALTVSLEKSTSKLLTDSAS